MSSTSQGLAPPGKAPTADVVRICVSHAFARSASKVLPHGYVLPYRREDVVGVLWERGARLRAGLALAVDEAGWQGLVRVEGAGDPHLRLRFAQPNLGRAFSAGMALRGILWHQDCANVMAAHTQAQMDDVAATAWRTLVELAQSPVAAGA